MLPLGGRKQQKLAVDEQMLRYQGGLKSKLLPMAVWRSDVFKEVSCEERRETNMESIRGLGQCTFRKEFPRMKENILQCEIHWKRMYDCQVP